MATTSTHASTQTSTRTRVGALKVQFGIPLRRLTDLSASYIDRLLRGLDERWIAKVRLFGIDRGGYARGCLLLRVDWQLHAEELRAGHVYVELGDDVVVDEALPELHYPLEFFKTYVRENALTVRLYVDFTPEVNGDPKLLARARRELGLVPATAPRWPARFQERWQTPEELREMRIGYQFLP